MTINLTQARKLTELGVRKQADFYYCSYKGAKFNKYYKAQVIQNTFKYVYHAYDAEELLGMLRGALEIYRHPSEKRTWRICGEHGEPIYGATLTEALGNKLIYDLENGIITAEEANR